MNFVGKLAVVFWVLSVGVLAIPCECQVQAAFKWTTKKSDPALWASASTALKKELAPDDQKATEPYLAMKYKYISRIGVFGSSALVLIGERESEKSTLGTFYLAFNFDTTTGVRQIGEGWMEWRFARLAQFEPTAVPDVLFTYLTCTECEADKLLSSYYYNSALKGWDVRRWAESDEDWNRNMILRRVKGLTIAGDVEPGGDEIAFNCVWGVKDYTQDGFDDVAVVCRSITEDHKRKRTMQVGTLLYSLRGGRFTGDYVSSPEEQQKIKTQLCTDHPSNVLCRAASTTK